MDNSSKYVKTDCCPNQSETPTAMAQCVFDISDSCKGGFFKQILVVFCFVLKNGRVHFKGERKKETLDQKKKKQNHQNIKPTKQTKKN